MNEIVNFGNGQRLKVVVLKGETGENGRGIVSIEKTSSLGRVDTYTITYTDGTTSTFDVTNGGGSGSQVDTVNGMTGNVVLTYTDVNALPDTTQLKDLTQDSTHRTVTDPPSGIAVMPEALWILGKLPPTARLKRMKKSWWKYLATLQSLSSPVTPIS